MAKSIEKRIGTVSKEICDRYNIHEFQGFEIYQELRVYRHVEKHAKEFKSIGNFQSAIFNIEKMIANSLFVYYDKIRKSLQYFGEINEYVCYVVKIKIKKNRCYLATLYPISKEKLNRIKEQSYFK